MRQAEGLAVAKRLGRTECEGFSCQICCDCRRIVLTTAYERTELRQATFQDTGCCGRAVARAFRPAGAAYAVA